MVSLDKYSCMCEKSKGLEIFKSKKDIQYVKCKKSTCGFFVAAEDLYEYLNNISENLNILLGVPLCNHGRPATLYVSKSEKNPNRLFFKCSQREPCKYFQWGDTYPTDETIKNKGASNYGAVKREMCDKETMTINIPKPKRTKKTKVATEEDTKLK